jgi:O-antigen/teichoic acid export membrane protein
MGLGMALGLVVGAPTVIDVMAGSKFADAEGALRIQSLTMLASFVLAPWGFALLSLHLHRGLLVANVTAFATSATAVTLLASSGGAQGAAVGTVLGETVLAVGYLVVLTRAQPAMRPRVGTALKGILAVVPALAVGFLLGLPSLAAAVLALGVYALGLVVLRAIPDELLEALPWRR